VINYQAPGGKLRENVFVTCQELKAGHVTVTSTYLDSFNGTKWTWSNLGAPAAGTPACVAAVANYQVAGGTLHENVLVVGSDGNLYLDFWDGAHWKKVNLGGPGAGADLDHNSIPAANNYLEVSFLPPSSVLHEHIFVLDTDDDNLYDNYWNGSQWTWQGPIV
jgi:hypothetical protein